MKKSSIAVISIFGTVGGLLLAIGMCMCLLLEWNAFAPGVVLAQHGYTEANVNDLLGRNHVDPYSGFPAYKGMCCNIQKNQGE